VPAREEWPATGLDDGAQPRSLLDALCWPLRLHAERAAGLTGKPVPVLDKETK
jgi:hypothetical protein